MIKNIAPFLRRQKLLYDNISIYYRKKIFRFTFGSKEKVAVATY
jgi:hypothetical protein